MFGSIINRLTGEGGDGEIDHAGVEAAIAAGTHAIVDVREAHEYAAGHVPGAVNMPLSRFEPSQLPSGKPVILTCQAGVRSARACEAARGAGREDALNHRGGFAGWRGAGGAVEF